MAIRLHVGNLGYNVSSDELRALFEPFGPVLSAQVLSDRETGRNRGFGFIEMEVDAADKAIAKLDGTEFQGRRLNVSEARPKGEGGGGYRGNGGRGGN